MPQLDIILFGATSFVGQIMSRYMLETFPPGNGLSWGIAGRSESKLSQLKSSLGPSAESIPVLLANAEDPESINALCNSTKVIVSTVGPYALHGEPMVKACASLGTDYCDLTGEPQWIASMLKRYESVAKISGARIVHCCGFDSIPSDLGVYYLQQKAIEKFGHSCNSIKMRVKTMKGGASGGTIASMLNLIKEATKNPALRKLLANPYALCPEQHNFKARQLNLKSAKFDEDMHAWIAPFVMAAINTRVVHRSNALLDDLYGVDFLYDEAMVTGKETKGGVSAALLSAGLGGFMLAAALPPTRWFMEKLILPKPGEGPSPKEQLAGRYDLRFIGKTNEGRQLRCKVTGDRDPGYGSTAKMLGQAAACLAMDVTKEDLEGGFWTPASAFGDKLIPRLESYAGLTFNVE